MSDRRSVAPGHPGIEPRWTTSSKSGVGTAISPRSRVWFTLSHGILNEIYYPRVDQANMRDMGFLVTRGDDYFSEEKRDTTSHVDTLRPGVPGYRLTNTSRDGRYRFIKTIISDPDRDAVLQEIEFQALKDDRDSYRVYALLAPHLGNQGADNSAWVGDYKGVPAIFASRAHVALALASSANFLATSCGYVGASDGWQQLNKHKRLTDCYAQAPHGNVALTAQMDIEGCDGRFVVAIGFGPTPAEAGEAVRAVLLRDFRNTCDAYVNGWLDYHAAAHAIRGEELSDEYLLSVAMLRVHEDKTHPGGTIASLSIPWGSTKGDHDIGGYHVVWPRDLVESATALLAAGHQTGAREALRYLMVTQEADGHWPQNMWLDGKAWWSGTQLDETGLPILLADQLLRHDGLGDLRPWPMVRRAASYLVRYGPVTPEDRWEEDGGYSTFTLAVQIAALLSAADFADAAGDDCAAVFFRETADMWNASIEQWTYVTDTPVARGNGVEGYYVRIAPRTPSAASADPRLVLVRNRPDAEAHMRYDEMISPDVLSLVWLGLRAPDDSRILNTIHVIDRMLRTDTRNGPVWHRYNADGYGEHEDGSAFDGTGIGRGWPLLAGERGHYEVANHRPNEARRLLETMRAQAGNGGLIPEQIWDAQDIPARELYNGCPSGSAMPLVWAHAEYVKLVRSLQDGRVFDTPPQTVQRYITDNQSSPYAVWRFNNKARTLVAGKTLRIETRAPTVVHWSSDGWKTTVDSKSRDTTVGIWVTDLPTASLREGATVQFTLYWPEADRWEGCDYTVNVVGKQARVMATV
jgi:glucoamylase